MKKSFFLVLMLLFATFLFANGGREPSTESSSEEPLVFEFMQHSATKLPPRETDAMWQGIYEKFNIDCKMTLVATEYEQQLNIRVASGNLPDWFQVNSKPYFVQYAREGLLLDISKYADQMSDYYAYAPENRRSMGTIDGNLYALVSPPPYNMNTYWVRKDWLDSLNKTIPVTTEDYIDILKAITFNDPDGNGKQDTYGLTGGGLSTFTPIFGSYNLPLPGNLFLDNGELESSVHSSRMPEALAQIKEMIEMGIVDPAILSMDGTQAFQKSAQQQVGMTYLEWWRFLKINQVEQIKAVNPNAEWIQLEAPIGPYGQVNHSIPMSIGSIHVVSAELEKDPYKRDKMLSLLNWVSTPEGQRLVLFGKEGVHHNLVDGKVIVTDKMFEDDGKLIIPKYQFTGRNEVLYLPTKFPNFVDQVHFSGQAPSITTYTTLPDLPEGYNNADAQRFIEENIVAFIFGKKPLTEYNKFLNELDKTFRYGEFLKSSRIQLKEMGYIN